MQDSIEYEALVQNALRNVIRDILADVAKSGQLPGEHHFYISFATQAPGVEISARLKARFPESMTIVLQHRFWDMKVSADYFTVRLSFGGIAERLRVPFAAMQGFYDPSSAFEVAFTAAADSAPAAETGEGVVAFPPQNRETEKKPQDGAASPPGSHLPPEYAKALTELDGGSGESRSAREARGAQMNAAENDSRRPRLVKEAQQQADSESGAAEKETSASVVSLDAFRKK